MGWGRMPIRGVVNEYNDEVKKIDEHILTLIQERKAITGKKRFSPKVSSLRNGQLDSRWTLLRLYSIYTV